jgi:thiamine monophosphate synthase
MEAVHSPEIYKVLLAWYHIPKDNILNNDRCENLKPNKKITVSCNVMAQIKVLEKSAGYIFMAEE